MRRFGRLLLATGVGLVALGVGRADAHVMQPRAAAPSLRFTTRPAAVSAVARPKVAWTATITAKTTACTLDGKAVKACRSGLALPALTSGSHTFKVTVTSAAGKKVSGQVQWLTDLIAPSAPVVTGAPSGWVASSSTLTASGSTDRGGSGLAHYQRRSHVDGGAWGATATAAALTIAASGCTWVEFRAVDGAGNVSAWSAAARVCIDQTAPTLSPSGGSAAWSRGPVTIGAGASDSQSGVAGIFYETSSNGGASWSEPTPGTSATITGEGTTVVRFQATDAAGNATGWTVPAAGATARIDDTAPTLSAHGGSSTWTNQPVTISATVSDAGAGGGGVQHETSTNGGATWSLPAAGTSVQVTAGGTTIVRFQAADAVGNTSAWTTPDADSTAMIDITPPTLSPAGGSDAWTATPVTIAAGASDSQSGLAAVIYETSTTGGASWSAPAAGSSVQVAAGGTTLVRFQATDNLGNTSGWTVPDTNATVRIDTTPPIVSAIGGSAVWTQRPVTVTASVSDAGVSGGSVSYETSVDGGLSWSAPAVGGSVRVTGDGITLVRFQATDALGNTSAWTVPQASSTAMIDTTAPTLAPSGGSYAWSLTSLTITSGASDSGSGIASVVYELSWDHGQTWTQPTSGASVTVQSYGTILVRFQATDVAGNTSSWTVPDEHSTSVIDGWPPNLSFSGGSSSWTSGPVTISVVASEPISGVASVSYKTSTDSGHTWSAPQPGSSVTITADGATEVAFDAIDNAGNDSGWTISPGWAKIDTTPPTLAPTGGSTSWHAAPVTIRSGAADAGSGVTSVVYETSSDNGQSWSQPQSGSSVTISANGTTLVRFQATDAMGYTSGWSVPGYSTTAMVDTVTPTVTTSGGGTTFTSGPVTIDAAAQDDGSGVAALTYQTSDDDELTWSAPQAGDSVVVTRAGQTIVRFQATDSAGNTTAVITEALIDVTPPTITAAASPSTWTSTEPVVTATVNDTSDGSTWGSGVASTSILSETSTDGGQTWSAPVAGWRVTGFSEGVSEVRFQATDRVGNASDWTAPVTVYYDPVAPSVAPSGWDPVAGQQPVTISANAADADSGVLKVWYRTWNQTSNAWGSAVVGASAAVDTTTTLVEFQAEDNAGNYSPWVEADTASQLIDTTPPTVTLSGGSTTWRAGPVTVSAQASDTLSGVATVLSEQSTDGGLTWTAPAAGASVVVSASGTTLLRFQAADNAGNASQWVGPGYAGTVDIDGTPPTLSPTGGSTVWTQGPVTINAGAADGQSGLDSVWYETSTDGGSTWSSVVVGSSAVISADGITLVRFKASDEVTNTSGWSTVGSGSTAMIDLTPPTVSPSGGSLSAAGGPVTIVPNAQDSESGVASTQYELSADGGTTWSPAETGDSVTVDRDGTTLVRFRAIDVAGNVGGWSVPDADSTVVVSNVLTLTPSGGNGSDAWSLGPVTVSAGEQDSESPNVAVEYETSTNGASWSDPHDGDSVTVSANGVTLVRFEAADDAGNLATWTIPDASSTVDIDLTPPTFAPTGGGVPSAGPVTIQAGAADAGSGVASVVYETSTDNGSTWSAPQPGSSVAISAIGRTLVRFQGVDNFGNVSDWSTPTMGSTALIDGGQVDIMLVVDRTGSMAGSDFTSEKTGLLTGLLPGLDPAVDNVGMAVFPPDSNGISNVCSAQSSSSYNVANPLYTVVPLGNSYATSPGQLVSSSPLVTDLNCLKTGGGTNYASALEAADAELLSDGRPAAKKVIILLSDGAANSGVHCPAQAQNGTWPTSTDPHCTNPCATGVADAQSYQAAGVIVYTVQDSGGEGTQVCQKWSGSNESPAITPQAALLGMASPGDYFNVADPVTLPTVFQGMVGGVISP